MDVGRSKPDVYLGRASRVHVALLPVPMNSARRTRSAVCVSCVYMSVVDACVNGIFRNWHCRTQCVYVKMARGFDPREWWWWPCLLLYVGGGWCILFSFLLYYTTAACCCCSFCFLPLLLLLLFLNTVIHRLVAGIIIKIIMCIILWWNKSHSCLLFLLFNLQCHCVPWYYGSSIECMLVSSVAFIILRPSTLRS